ncbi:MAG: cation-transporting P-type ATPase [Actinobacteria bacterium]|nr:cation-transporting P-type ATPase [Actinomycetota bacterium]MCG2789688.1 cation-transporting P-type ATPase [Actinomycetes bacterium]
MENSDYFSLDTEKIFKKLGVSKDGLSDEEAAKRLKEFGPNALVAKRKRPLILKFFDNFVHLLAIILWVAAGLCFIPKVDMPQLGYAIILVVIINAVFSFLQEFRAEKALEALKNLIPSYSKVLRSGEIQDILSSELVPGDIIVLEEGDNITADARLIEAYDIRTNNSVLTGESDPQRKNANPVHQENADELRLANVVYTGTSVTNGSGRAVVFATGMKTQFGKIANLTQNVKEQLSPLQIEINKTSQILAFIAVGVGVLFFVLSLFTVKLGFVAAFVFAIGCIVAFVPEGLLPTVTITLAMGVQRMAKRNALIKKLSSVETLGSATVICTDKTGTLTQNEMTIKEMWANGKSYDLTGVGYNPEGDFFLGSAKLNKEDASKALKPIARAMSYCNNARLIVDASTKQWTIKGDPTEGALLVAAKKSGFEYEVEIQDEIRTYLLPFDSRRKRMSSIHNAKEGIIAFVKGAPKEMLSICSKIYLDGNVVELSKKQRDEILKINDDYARKALRVLAIAYRDLKGFSSSYSPESVEQDLVFIGLAAMMDPPRLEVEAAVKQCYKSGIKIIMITGDYGLTADAIARKTGIVKGESKIYLGSDIEDMSEEQLREVLKQENIIFARVSPENKMSIADALKKNGHVVAMTGDGVNDAPALKSADIGIAMGIAGTDVAKEAADMILTDDNFASIVSAIEEGRAVFDNIRRFITYILASNIPEAIPFIAMVLFKIPLPLTVMQILAVDLGTDMLPALALGTEPPEPGIMNRPPRPRNERLLNFKVLVKAYLFLGPIEAAMGMLGYFYLYSSRGYSFEMLRIIGANTKSYINDIIYLQATTMSLAAIIMTQIGNAFACKTNFESVFKVGFFKNKLLLWGILAEVALVNILIYVPHLNKVFNNAPIGITDWLVLIAFIPSVLIAEELRKLILKFMKKRQTRILKVA